MGVLNRTPNSFSDANAYENTEAAIQHGRSLVAAGAGIIDIGGESTGPGSCHVPADTELQRIEALVKALAPEIPVSIDTYKAEVAEHCLKLGALMINDVSALRADPNLAEVVKSHKAHLVLMYSKQSGEHPHADTQIQEYDDIIETVYRFLSERIEFAVSCGIQESQLLLDPGMGGFLSPNPKYSWELLRRLPELIELLPGYPFLIGTSRKGFLGGALEERDPISQLTGLAAHLQGAAIIRTHNVQMAAEFIGAWRRIW